jgi:peptidoglycan/xylan/chitin deacetylase (PgdA/CDA1 family)
LPQRPFFSVLAWAGALGFALAAFGAPPAQAAARAPGFWLESRVSLAESSHIARPRFHIRVQPSLLDLGQVEPDKPARNNIPMPPPPVPFDERPVDNSVVVFIPHGVAAPVPDALPGHSPTVTLTFDDCGTAAQIQAVVAALTEVHEQGIFFITGQCRDHFPWLVSTLQAGGHLVCNHTYSHPDLRRLSNAAIRSEISRGVMAGCPYFRPPYGAWDGPRGRVARIAAEFGLQPMLWDVDSRDWAGAPADRIAALARARGGVILLHLHGTNTAEAIRLIG